MPDPFAPTPCRDCKAELPYKVHAAASLLFEGYQLDPRRLGEQVADALKRRPQTDKDREDVNARYPSLLPMKPITDEELGMGAVRDWLFDGFDAEHLVAAVQHYGDLGHELGSACDQIQHAAWCHERTPDHGGWEDKRPRECTLEAGHEGAHRFEYELASAR